MAYLRQSDGGGAVNPDFQIAIISSKNDFYRRMKWLEAQGVPRQNIIDGRVFQVPNFNFLRLLNEGVAYGIFDNNPIEHISSGIYPCICQIKESGSIIKLGRKSYIGKFKVAVGGIIFVGNFSSISWNIDFQLRMNGFHNVNNVLTYAAENLDWKASKDFFPDLGICEIKIGSDVWIGQNTTLKSNNPENPLIIGDGAVIASDSVVVKNVPPYAIVGGNPAQFIKWRFDEKIIESLLKIQWWNWDIDKIYENFKYFNRVEEFVAMHDK